MRMLIPAILLLLLTGCEAWREKTGTVLSETGGSIRDVNIWYYGKKSKTDSLGHFHIKAFIGCISCSDFEVYFEKDGFQTKYVNFFSKEFGEPRMKSDSAMVFLKPVDTKQVNFDDVDSSAGVRLYSKVALGIGFLTLIVSLFLKVKFKFLWIVLILWGNFKIKYNVIAEILDYEFFDFFLTMIVQNKWNIFFIPLVSILFWLYYFKIHEKMIYGFSDGSSKPQSH